MAGLDLGRLNLSELRDPKAIRALAHPRRLEILAILREGQPYTVSELARALNDSTASISYHVHQLAEYGFVERAPGGRGRNKPWVAPRVWYTFDPEQEHAPDTMAASKELFDVFIQRAHATLSQFSKEEHLLPAEWRGAATTTQDGYWLTISEIQKISKTLAEFLEPLSKRSAQDRPDDSAYVEIIFYGLPSPRPGPA